MAAIKATTTQATAASTGRGTLRRAWMHAPGDESGRCAGRLPLFCHASVASSKAAAFRGSAAIQPLTLASSFASRSGPCNSVTHLAACARMRRGAILFRRAIRDSTVFRFPVFHDGEQRARDMALYRDVRYPHVRGDLRIAVARSMREIDFAGPPAHRIQQRPNMAQALLKLQCLFRCRVGGDQRTAGIVVLDGHLLAQVESIAAML